MSGESVGIVGRRGADDGYGKTFKKELTGLRLPADIEAVRRTDDLLVEIRRTLFGAEPSPKALDCELWALPVWIDADESPDWWWTGAEFER